MRDLDELAARAETVAASQIARDALANWKHAQAQAAWRHKRDDEPAPEPRDRLELSGPALGACSEPGPHPEFEPGRAVWYQPPLPAGVVKFVRAMVMPRRDNLGRILVASIDEPKLQFYASPKQLRRRYAGEIAPGINPQNPTGDDAA